jgi:hypothetical protein
MVVDCLAFSFSLVVGKKEEHASMFGYFKMFKIRLSPHKEERTPAGDPNDDDDDDDEAATFWLLVCVRRIESDRVVATLVMVDPRHPIMTFPM